MSTSFETINNKFLNMIDDYELSLISEDELNEVLWGYLDQARSLYFPQCKSNLDDYTETYGVGEFTADLTSQEQYILALGMKKSWLSSKLNNADLMSKSIGDRDYKGVQGTSYLKELRQCDNQIEDEIHRYAVSYTWKNLDLSNW